MSDAEKQTIKMKLVKTPDGNDSCDACHYKGCSCPGRCGAEGTHLEPLAPIKIEIVEDKP